MNNWFFKKKDISLQREIQTRSLIKKKNSYGKF